MHNSIISITNKLQRLDSRLRCNKCSIHLSGSFPVKGLPRGVVHEVDNVVEILLCYRAEISVLGVDSSEPAVSVLILAPLSRGMRITKVDSRSRILFYPFP